MNRKNNLRRILSAALSAALVLSLAAPALAVETQTISGYAPVAGGSELSLEVLCSHDGSHYEDNGDGKTHDHVCGDCGEILGDDESHRDDNGDWICDDCGGRIDCGHPDGSTQWKDNGDGTHDQVCDDCGTVLVDNEEHVDEDGNNICDKCQAVITCLHEHVTYTDNGDGTHTGHCSDCDKDVYMNEAHEDMLKPEGDGMVEGKDCVCDKCGAEHHADLIYVDNNDGKTHDGNCKNCGKLAVVDDEAHEDLNPEDGMCDKCGFDVEHKDRILIAAVPAKLPIVAYTNGSVTVPDASIENKTEWAIEVESMGVKMDDASGWSLTDGDRVFSKADKDAKLLAMGFRRTPVAADGGMELDPANWTVGANGILPLNMWARVPAQSQTSEPAGIGRVEFTLGWADDGATQAPELDGYQMTVGSCEHGTPTSSEVRTDANGIVTELPGVENCDTGYKFSRWTAVIDGETVTVDIGTRLTSDTVLNAAFADGTSIDRTRMDSLLKTQARTIRFDKGDPADGVDISTKQDRSVLATLDTKTNEGVIYLNDSYLSGLLSQLFMNYTILTSADLSGLDTSAVTNMNRMFYDCDALTTLDLSGLDTSVVTDMGNMFTGCSSLTTLDVSGFDTSVVTDMYNMFNGCSSLTTLDVSSFDTSAVTDMSGMFQGCKSLTTLYVKDEAAKTKISGSRYFPTSTCTIIVGSPEQAGTAA